MHTTVHMDKTKQNLNNISVRRLRVKDTAKKCKYSVLHLESPGFSVIL